MADLDLSGLTAEQRPTGAWAAALVHALARDEAAGRRPERLTEPRQDTWRRFRGRLTATDFLALLFEDAAVLHRVPFDPAAVGGSVRPEALPEATAESWLSAIASADLSTPGPDYILEQAKRIGLPTRLARSDLHVVKPHQKVLELPGTGGQLAHHLVSAQRDLTLQDNFTVACGTWQELTLAGVVALDLGAPHTDFAVRAELRPAATTRTTRCASAASTSSSAFTPTRAASSASRISSRSGSPTRRSCWSDMAANFIPIGEPAHDAERQALRLPRRGPARRSYTVYGNAVARRAQRRRSTSSTRSSSPRTPSSSSRSSPTAGASRARTTTGGIPRRSAARSSSTAHRAGPQVHLKHESFQAGQVWVRASSSLGHHRRAACGPGQQGPRSHPQDDPRRAPGRGLSSSASARPHACSSSRRRRARAARALHRRRQRSAGRARSGACASTRSSRPSTTTTRSPSCSGERALRRARAPRIYSIPPLATDAQRDRIAERARWEAQVLGRLGRSEGILSADPPFADEAGIVLPLEHFKGITLTTWVERYGPDAREKENRRPPRAHRPVDAHRGGPRRGPPQGVVHRLLRPRSSSSRTSPSRSRCASRASIWPSSSRATTTIAPSSLTTVADERLVFAAPEVVTAFSSAEPASDQFSLGAILALLLTGQAALREHARS
jgi:hypothetical protein